MIRTYSNKQRGSECTFPFIYDLSLTIRRLSFSSKWYFLFSWHFRSNNLQKIGKKLITEFHRVQQTKWHELNQTDRERWNVHFDSLMIISHFKKYFFLSKKVLLVIMTQNTKNLQKWVNSWNLTNDGSLILSRLYPSICRSSPPKVFLGKGVRRIGSKLIGEQPCWSSISIKLQSNFTEITIRHGCSPVNLPHIFLGGYFCID